jgi:hypothetical protein
LGFRHISELAGDVMRRLELDRAVQASALESAQPAARHGCEGGDRPLGGDQSVAFAQAGGGAAAQTELKKSEAVAPAVAVVGHRFLPTIGRRNCIAMPHATSPVAAMQFRLMMEWTKGQHHSHPFALATLSASKASPTTVSRPKYTNLLIAQPTQE